MGSVDVKQPEKKRKEACWSENVENVKQLFSYVNFVFQKNGYDFNACNNLRDTLYNTDIINSVVKLIVHSPVGKIV